jgi:hypothetical protein
VTRGLQVDVNEVWTLALLEAQHAPDVVLDAWEQAFRVSFLVRVAASVAKGKTPQASNRTRLVG